ncbi:signal peptidase II [Biformimicrobium ophioploci]|uniref:Lipoprotein signal peptidase n=1 Tax=Biformimicrobium ophioploci TaxID=3036711 RepID=A0ABQ6M2L9_9GAMM|nr:signal peptidase II [Microbulbifer sp. NKW57]GMG88590.1 signal peptidase II [Microbulbifer sp. NKW57]
MPDTRFRLFAHPWRWYLLAALLVWLDLVTKTWSKGLFEFGPAMQVIPDVLRFTYAENRGAAFSFLANAGGWQRWLFGAIALGFSVFVIRWIWKLDAKLRWEPLALALILSGAVGNLYDRVVFGYVRDFIHVYYQAWNFSFPVFNVADIAISIGAAMLVIDLLFMADKDKKEGSAAV